MDEQATFENDNLSFSSEIKFEGELHAGIIFLALIPYSKATAAATADHKGSHSDEE
jgi:hypothetical protein